MFSKNDTQRLGASDQLSRLDSFQILDCTDSSSVKCATLNSLDCTTPCVMAPRKSTSKTKPVEVSREEIEDIMKNVVSQPETGGGEPGPRTRSQAARNTNDNGPGSPLMPASRAVTTPHLAVVGSSTTVTGRPALIQRVLGFLFNQILRVLSSLYHILLFLSTIVLWVCNLIFSIFRYYMCFCLPVILLIIVLLLVVYFCIYALQQWDSTAEYWKPLSYIGVNTGFLTTLTHHTVCYTGFVQVPGYEICPSRSVIPLERNDSGQHWGLDKESVTLGQHIYPLFEEAFAENSSAEGVPSNVLRQIGFQEKIEWWSAQARKYKDLSFDLEAYMAREEIAGLRGKVNNTCYVPNNEEDSILRMQKNALGLHDRIVILVQALREVQSHTMRFEATFEATIKAPFLLKPTPPNSTCHEACKPSWWEWRRKRAWDAQEETRRQYVDSIIALRRILVELFEVVNRAAGKRRDVDGDKMSALKHSVTRAEQEKRCFAREEEAAAAAAKQKEQDMKWGALLVRWVSELIWQPQRDSASTETKYDKDLREGLREQRLALLARVAELASSMSEPLDNIRELLLERQESIKQIEAYTNAGDLRRVANGTPKVPEHAKGLVDLADWQIEAENNRFRREERRRAEMVEKGKGDGSVAGAANPESSDRDTTKG